MYSNVCSKNGFIEQHEYHCEHCGDDGSHGSHIGEEQFVCDLGLEDVAATTVPLGHLGKADHVYTVTLGETLGSGSLDGGAYVGWLVKNHFIRLVVSVLVNAVW